MAQIRRTVYAKSYWALLLRGGCIQVQLRNQAAIMQLGIRLTPTPLRFATRVLRLLQPGATHPRCWSHAYWPCAWHCAQWFRLCWLYE